MIVEVLGNVQDGGVPHLGCECDICERARKNSKRMLGTSILLRENDKENSVKYLIDVTPDVRHQIKGSYLDGVFIPHAQLGHITGLLYFGEEGLDADGLNVYCSEGVEDFLMKNDPFRFLIDRRNISIESFSDEDIEIQGASIEAVCLHHSQTNHKTSGYMIKGDDKKLFYLSDVTEFNDRSKEKISEADIAIIDGTFWSKDELDRYEEVPHPTIQNSMEKFSDLETEIYFTHFNHTNPVLRDDSDERKELEERGFNFAEKGLEFRI